MITHLEIANFRSLGDVKLRLNQLSVFVGPNGSGKSNLLDALGFVSEAVRTGLSAAVTHRHGIDAVRRRSGGHPFNLRFAIKFRLSGKTRGEYGFEIAGARVEEYRVKTEWARVVRRHPSTPEVLASFTRQDDEWSGPPGVAPRLEPESLALTSIAGDARFSELADFLAQITVYSIFPDTLREPQKFDHERPMKRHGENWVSVLRDLERRDDKGDLLAGLGRLTGDIEDVRIGTAGGYIAAEFKQRAASSKSKRWFGAAQQSDGTLRIAGLLTALLQTPQPPVTGIEEPELTIHPGALPMVYDFIDEAAERTQVLVTTHSPILLDLLDLETCEVFVVERREGVTEVKPVDEVSLRPVRDRLLSLGALYQSGDLQLSLFDRSA